jgi:ferric-dicitrate binding protein FerR (iron transport regulator)
MMCHLLAIVGALLWGAPAAPTVKDEKGTVIAMRNRAEACAPANSCRKLDFGSKVSNGDSLKTFADSRLTVRFPTGSRMDMGPNSLLVLASIQSDGKKAVARWGEFDFEVKKPDNKGRFQVRTPVAVAGAEGTKFRVEVDTATGDSKLSLKDGLLSIVPDDPRFASFLMHPGDALEIRSGMEPVLQNLEASTSGPMITIKPVPTADVPVFIEKPPTTGTLHIEVIP